MPNDFDFDPTSLTIPQTKVSASIRRQRRPSTMSISIPIEGRGSSRDEAYAGFQTAIRAFQEVTKSLEQHLSSHKIGLPVETEEEAERTFRSSTTHIVAAKGVLVIGTPNGLGDVLAELLRREIEFETPNFDYPQEGEISPEDYEFVCAKARRIAESAARGSGCTLGRVLNIDFPSSYGGRALFRPFRETHLYTEMSESTTFLNTVDYFANPDSQILGLLSSDVPTYEDEFTVTVTFELA